MLKIVKTSLAITLASFVFSASVQAAVSDASQGVCSSVNAEDNGQLRKKMKAVAGDYPTKIQDNNAAFSCVSGSLIRSALVSNQMEAGTLLVRKIANGDFSAVEIDGKRIYALALQKAPTESAIVLTQNDSI